MIGSKGAEGKSWIQEELARKLGARGFHTTMNKKYDSILYALSKCQLSLIDFFIFNIPRCFEISTLPYNVLEEIKDGKSLSVKYQSKQLRFKTPNTVLIFSNVFPTYHKMSLDRWKIFKIENDELKYIDRK